MKSTINGVTTNFIGNHYEVSGSTVTKYYFAGTSRIAMRVNSTLSYLLTDHLGSTSITTNSNGALISELRYAACPLRFTSGVLREGSSATRTGQRPPNTPTRDSTPTSVILGYISTTRAGMTPPWDASRKPIRLCREGSRGMIGMRMSTIRR